MRMERTSRIIASVFGEAMLFAGEATGSAPNKFRMYEDQNRRTISLHNTITRMLIDLEK